jgi:hypothetical protein
MVSSGLFRRVALVRTDGSEEPGTCFIRVTKIGELGTTQAATNNRRTQRTSVLQEPHGVTTQKTPFFIVTAVKTSNLTMNLMFTIVMDLKFKFSAASFLCGHNRQSTTLSNLNHPNIDISSQITQNCHSPYPYLNQQSKYQYQLADHIKLAFSIFISGSTIQISMSAYRSHKTSIFIFISG